MTKDQFSKLYNYMQHEFGVLNKKLDEKADKSDLDKVFVILDDHTDRLKRLKLELGALSAKVDRFHPEPSS